MYTENEIATLKCIDKIKNSLMPQIPQLKSESMLILMKCKDDIIKAEAKLLSTPPQITDSYNVVSYENGWSETCINSSEIEKYKNLKSTDYISGLDLAQDSLKRIGSYTKAIEFTSNVENADQLNMIAGDLLVEHDLGLSCIYNNNYKQQDKMQSYYDSMDSCFETWDALVIKFSYSGCLDNEME